MDVDTLRGVMGHQAARGPVLFLALVAVIGCAWIAACGRDAGPISIALVQESATAPALIRVSGLSSSELAAIRVGRLTEDGWHAVLRVTVAGLAPDAPPLSGRYAVTESSVEFAPLFPLDPGREYSVSFDLSQVATARAGAPVTTVVSRPSVPRGTATTVVRMLPTADRLPENLLRVYLEFSAPMSRENGRDFLRLLDERGRNVPDAFLALDIEFWSPDHRRYTIFFDPGRVKRGILPNDQLGRALVKGHRYTIEVDPRWRDANGQPLAAPFRRTLDVDGEDLSPIRLADWRLEPPLAGTRDPLVVRFPKPLDHGLLQRALGVARGVTATLAGEVTIGPQEREWRFTPSEAWVAGGYDVFVLSILEDPAGNRIGRSFDIDTFDRIDQSPQPERMTLPFLIR